MTATNARRLTAVILDEDRCSFEYVGEDHEPGALAFPANQVDGVLLHLLTVKRHLVEHTEPGTGWGPCADRMRVAIDQDSGSFIFSFWVNGAELSFMVSRTVGAASVRQIREGAAVH